MKNPLVALAATSVGKQCIRWFVTIGLVVSACGDPPSREGRGPQDEADVLQDASSEEDTQLDVHSADVADAATTDADAQTMDQPSADSDVPQAQPEPLTWTFHSGSPITQFAANGEMVVGLSGNTIVSSTDGLEWEEHAVDQQMADVTFGMGMFVAVGAEGAIYNSENGTEWTAVDSPLEEDLLQIAFANAGFVVISGSTEAVVL